MRREHGYDIAQMLNARTDTAERPDVVHVTPDPQGRGGMAAVVRGLLASSLAERYALSAITTHRPGSALARVWVSMRGGAELSVWCVSHSHGLVHVHAAVRGSLYRKAFAILVARALRRPVLLQVHAGPGDIDAFAMRLGPVRRRFLRAVLRRTQSIVSVSSASAGALVRAFALDAVGVIPNAAPSPPAHVGPPSADVAVFLGGLEDPAKGGQDLVAALPALLAAAPTLRVVLAGPGDPPPELSPLGDDRVRWRGWLDPDAKRRALAESGIVLIPSRSEGLPVVLLEAMTYGRAIVATRVGGIPELLSDDIDGVLVAPRDAHTLVAATAALTRDSSRVERLGAAARRRVAVLTERDVVDRIDATYRVLLQR